MSNKILALEFEYVVITDLSPVLPKGELLALDNGYYVNKDESVVIKSTNYTGKIIKKWIPPKEDGK